MTTATFRYLIIILLMVSQGVFAQETVFSGLAGNLKRADKFFENQRYRNALELYRAVEKKGKASDQIYLKLAHTCHQLNQPDQVVYWSEQYLSRGNTLKAEDAYRYAEGLISEGNYQQAITWLKKYQQLYKDNQAIAQKIWRLQNIHHLYTDSSYFEVVPLTINSDYAEFAPALSNQKLIFVSNRKEKGGISKIDGVTGQPFQSLYQVDWNYDSATNNYVLDKPEILFRQNGKGIHLGAASICGDSMLITRNSPDQSEDYRVLQLFWAHLKEQNWVEAGPFQHNSPQYSLSYPSFSADGNTLYLISDMPGGHGGMDIYRSVRSENGWSQPKNLGVPINTDGDEIAPFIHRDNTLYFASNGHGGFGGFDVFSIRLKADTPGEVDNMGFPINSSRDDFGLVLNPQGTNGFLSSNRANGGFDDDLYAVEVDLQSYPLVISGHLRFHNPDWSEPTRLQLLPGAKMILIDHLKNRPVYETTSDQNGTFSLEIPYASQYKLEVRHQEVGTPAVSLEIPKNRKLHTNHEIVVVKEKFKNQKQEPEALNIQPVDTGDQLKRTKDHKE